MDSEGCIAIFIIIIILALVFGISFGVDSITCNEKTKDMGFNHTYSVFGGCKIEVNPGQWIPLDSYYFKQE